MICGGEFQMNVSRLGELGSHLSELTAYERSDSARAVSLAHIVHATAEVLVQLT